MGKFRDGMPVTSEAVTLILSTLDRIKEILAELERSATEPEGADADLIGGLETLAAAARAAESEPEPQITAGALVYQVLERALKPGEVSLDDLERAFRDTPARRRSAAPEPAAATRRDVEPEPADAAPPSQGADDPRQRRHARASDDHGLGAGADAQPAPRDRPAPGRRRLQGAAAAPLARHRRAAGRRHEDAHAADRHRLAEAAAGRARPLGGTREEDRARHAGRRDRARPPGARADQGSAHAHGPQLRRPRHRDARSSARAAGKPEKGTIRLAAYHEGGTITIEIADDGRGLDYRRDPPQGARARARGRGRARAHERRAGREVHLPPGLLDREGDHLGVRAAASAWTSSRPTSSSSAAPSTSASERGRGTSFTIKIPLTLAIVAALIVSRRRASASRSRRSPCSSSCA